jgi:hypothetical protein
MSPLDLIKAILPSLAVMAVGLVAVWWLRRGLSAWRQRSGWEGAALALSYLVGHLAQMGWLGFPPNNAAGWMPFLAAAGVIVSITAAPGLGPAWWRWSVRVAVIAAAVPLLLFPTIAYHGWSWPVAVAWFTGLGLAWLVTLAMWEGAALQAGPGAAVTAGLATSIGTALALLLFGSIAYGTFGGMVAAAVGLATVMVWWRGWPMRGLMTALGLLIPALLLLGVFMSELPVVAALLLAVTGLIPWLAGSERGRTMRPWRRVVVVAALSSLPVLPVIVWGVISFKHALETAY